MAASYTFFANRDAMLTSWNVSIQHVCSSQWVPSVAVMLPCFS